MSSGALDLGDHDDVDLVANLGHDFGEVIEGPGGVKRVDPGPELGVAHIDGLADLDEASAGGFLVG